MLMPNLWDMFQFKPGSSKATKTQKNKKFNGKLSFKNEKICPGCPPRLEKGPELPAIVLPDAYTAKNDSKIVTLVNLNDYKKKPKGPKGLF